MSMSPILGGNLFSLAFGRDVDSHISSVSAVSERWVRTVWNHDDASSIAIAAAGECTLGRDCYSSTIRVTATAALVALVLSVARLVFGRQRS